ncbi:hypothetical protein GCM10007183_03910 [Staphylococcus muscae]|uniref:Uncharacterized protein n=1 Tax=Staphylococcus muscae TaxID=1294 RepID=A0ABQ1HNK2_9STAP|nr:hypothetical protein GCM10007183_03910 [Staphylococcus muscae]
MLLNGVLEFHVYTLTVYAYSKVHHTTWRTGRGCFSDEATNKGGTANKAFVLYIPINESAIKDESFFILFKEVISR